jgi:DNA modification methylase
MSTKSKVRPEKNAAAKPSTLTKVVGNSVTGDSTTPSAPDKRPAVSITKAKGRPMLNWVGKRPLRSITSFPAQHVESYAAPTPKLVPIADEAIWQDWPQQFPRGGLLFHGDNKEVLSHLLANGFRRSVQLIYIDPPFDSGADYIRKVTLRGPRGSAKLDGESYTLGEQIQYADIWANDNYLQFMFERILLLKELLADDGSLFLHCDFRRSHHLRCLLDEVFGPDNFVNEIVWVHQIMGGSHEKRFPKAHETIFWYAKTNDYRLRSASKHVRVPFSEYVLKSMKADETGRKYYERRRMSRKATVQEAESKAHTRTYVDDPEAGTVATDVWDDMPSYQEPPDQRDGLELYPTQKTTKLLTRIVAAASDPGGLVLDSFCGSGVVARVAQQLGRRWIMCDINKGAIQITTDRLQRVISGQVESSISGPPLEETTKSEGAGVPAQLSFTTWRVNDYDLAIQHNEAVNLACEHIGVTRTLADSFFDGVLGKKLVGTSKNSSRQVGTNLTR